MSKIPTTAKRFKNWLAKQPAMPADLQIKAAEAQTAHDMLAANKTAKDFQAIKPYHAPKITAFETAYAEWKKQN